MKNKHIVFFDLETTSVNTDTARIVQLCAVKTDENFQIVDGPKKINVNPGVPIPKEASDVHGLTDEQVQDCKPFKAYAKGIVDFFSGCDLAGFNSNAFDLPLLVNELDRCGLTLDLSGVRLLDAFVIFRNLEKRDLAAALKFYCDQDIQGAHDAENDILATLQVFKAQVSRYEEVKTLDLVHSFCGADTRVDLAGKLIKNENGEIVYNFGKDKGKSVKANPGFGEWMLKNDFSKEVKTILKTLIK